MEFPKGASLPFGQRRGKNPARKVVSFIDGVSLSSAFGILTNYITTETQRPNKTHSVLFFRALERQFLG